MLTFDRLQSALPEESLRFPGAIMTIDIANLTGDITDFDSSIMEAYARLLQGLFDLQTTINSERADADPPQLPLNIISKTLASSSTDNPIYTYTVNFEISSTAILDAVIDPTAS